MADISLTIGGDASGATEALEEAGGAAKATGEEVGKSTAKWDAYARVMEMAAKAAVKFAGDVIKGWAEGERVQKQLTRAAGEYADALGEQAEAMSRLYAVDDDVIKQSQTLLTQWGGVGAASRETTQAILDYAAATGQDAVAATQDLIRNVESGGAGLAKMGIQIEATGDRGKDLALVVQALSGKFSGAAAADANSLEGRMRLAELAANDLRDTFGGFFATIESKLGLLEKASGVIRRLTDNLNGPMGIVEAFNKTAGSAGLGLVVDALFGGADDAAVQTERLAAAAEKLKSAADVSGATSFGAKHAKPIPGGALDYEDPSVSGMTARVGAAEEESARLQKIAEEEAKVLLDVEAEMYAESAKMREAASLGDERAYADFWKERRKVQEDELKAMLDAEKDAAEKMKQERERQESLWRDTGAAIGAAFVNALTDQLAKLAAGEEFDVALFIGDIMATTISIAATAIGTAYGQPALGAAIGNLAALGVRAGAGAVSRSRGGKGGGVGDETPRYHSGAWIGADERDAILQTGERVLSRREVQRMGGRSGVDRLAAGGAGLNVTITTLDGRSAAEGFMTRLGDGIRAAVRSGQGPMPALLGVSPR